VLILDWLRALRTWGPRLGLTSRSRPARLIDTGGCMADDRETVQAEIVGRVTHNVYDGSLPGTPVTFYVLRTADGKDHHRPEQEAFRAADGVLEFRT